MQRTTAAGSGSRSPAAPDDPLGHVAGRQEHRVVGIDARATRGQRGRGEQHVVQLDAEPAQVPGAHRLRQQPQPHHVAQVADRAVHAALVGEVRLPAVLGEHRRVELHADQAPGAAGDVAEPVRPAGTPTTADAGVVRPDGGDRQRVVHADLRADLGGERGQHLARRDDLGQQPGRQAERLDQRRRPAAGAGVEQAGGGGVGLLGDLTAGEPVAEQVRHQQRPPTVEHGLGGELVERVERQELQPGGARRAGPGPAWRARRRSRRRCAGRGSARGLPRSAPRASSSP